MNSSYSAQVEPIQRPRCAVTSTAVHRSGVDFCLNASRVGRRFAPECATASMFCTVLPVAAENWVRASHRGRRAFANELYVHQRDGHDWHAKVRLTGRSRLSNVTPSARTNGASWPTAACGRWRRNAALHRNARLARRPLSANIGNRGSRPQRAVQRAGKTAIRTAALIRNLTDELRAQFGHTCRSFLRGCGQFAMSGIGCPRIGAVGHQRTLVLRPILPRNVWVQSADL
jgi:hypothetical protein